VIPATWPEQSAYLAVFLAAAVEGEVVFVAASVLVTMGRLSPLGVFVAAALGGSVGDQFFFYALRGRLRSWLMRFPRLADRHDQIVKRLQRRATTLILACRFLPGLRIAIPAACAYAGIPAFRFTAYNLIGSMAWAGTILFFVSRVGPASLASLGLDAWWAPVFPAALIVAFFSWLGRRSKTLEAT
jgi:membrane protein DedA with SNARE-associated domain